MVKASKWVNRVLNGLIAFALLAMCILVFGNVILRYAFNSGITWSEEMARFFFVWMIFLGAIPALRENEHLGVDMLVKKLSVRWKKIVYIVSNLLILYTLWLVTEGGWKLAEINITSTAPATGLPLYFVSGVMVVMGVAMAVIVLLKLYRVFFTNVSIDELILTTDSEELIEKESTEIETNPRGVHL